MGCVNDDDDLSPVELELVNHCAAGTICNLSGRPEDQTQIRAWVVYELCVGTRWPVHAKGVLLGAARLNEPLDFEYATMRVPLTLAGCDITASLILTGASAPAIRVLNCGIHEDVDADMLRVRQFSLRGSMAKALRLAGATIDGPLDLIDAKLTGASANGSSLSADGLYVTDAFLRDGFEAAANVSLVGATVKDNLEMDGARLTGTDADGNSFNAAALHVTNAFLRRGFEAAGGVDLVGATVDGELDLSGAKLWGINSDGESLSADRLKVGGSVALRDGFTAAGTVRLVGATIDGLLLIEDTAGIDGLRLAGARCARLVDGQNSWPQAGRLDLQGFRFGALTVDTGFKQRLEWVRRQASVDWSTDPYEELAAYYQSTGDEDAARRMRIAKNNDELSHLKTTKARRSLGYRFWRRTFGLLLGYGYRRWPAGVLLVVTLAGAGVLFRWAEYDGAMVPNEPAEDDAGDPLPCGDAYPCFNSWVYGADVVLPIVDFGQDNAWRPVETSRGDQWWIWARWVFIALGWTLASVFVVAFTALVQRG
jgi:hypothetical protein